MFMLSHQFQSSAEKYSGFFEKYTLDTDIDSRYTALPEELNHWLITLGRILLTLGVCTSWKLSFPSLRLYNLSKSTTTTTT